MPADKSRALSFAPEKFKSTSAGALCLLPYSKKFGISQAINNSGYPGTKGIDKLSSILCFVALKSSNVRHWAGKRGKAMSSMLAIHAHDPDTGIINYGNTNVIHKNKSGEVLEFLDFYKKGLSSEESKLKYLFFDSKFTNYENLKKLDDGKVKFGYYSADVMH